MVGTAKSTVASSSKAAATAADEKRCRCRAVPPRRTGPRIPRMSPWTWNSGSACATTSSSVHSHADASASRFEAMARRGSTAPLGGPVVPDV